MGVAKKKEKILRQFFKNRELERIGRYSWQTGASTPGLRQVLKKESLFHLRTETEILLEKASLWLTEWQGPSKVPLQGTCRKSALSSPSFMGDVTATEPRKSALSCT